MPFTEFLANADNLAKLNQFVAIKQPLTVIRQTPGPGTPVVVGMTIEVQAISLSDIPLEVFIPDAPVAVRNLPVAELEKFVATDADVRSAVLAGEVAEPQRTELAAKFNNHLAGLGFAGTVSETDTTSLVRSLGSARLFGR